MSDANVRKRKINDSSKDSNESAVDQLDMEMTLASLFTDPKNKRNCFALVQHIYTLFKTTKHIPKEKDIILLNTEDYYTITFPEVRHNLLAISSLEAIIRRDPEIIRNVYVYWPKGGVPDECFKIEFDVFNQLNSRKRLPYYEPAKYRNNKCKETLSKLPTNEKFPKHWKRDMDVIADISDMIYNMEEFIPQITSNLKMNAASNSYRLTFDNFEKISYDFIEHLWNQFNPRITDIRFISSGLTTRRLVIDISGTGNEANRLPLVCRGTQSSKNNQSHGDKKSMLTSGFGLFKRLRLFG